MSVRLQGAHREHVTANHRGRIRAVECLGSRLRVRLSTVSPLQLSRQSSIGTDEAANTGGSDGGKGRERESLMRSSYV